MFRLATRKGQALDIGQRLPATIAALGEDEAERVKAGHAQAQIGDDQLLTDLVGAGQAKRMLYTGSLIDVLRGVPDDAGHVLMVGHNPGLEDLVFDLCPDDGTSPLRDLVWEKYPTAAIARMELNIAHWADIDRRCGQLTHFIRPRDLDPDLGPEDE